MEDSLSTEDESESVEEFQENTPNSPLSTHLPAEVTSIPLTDCPLNDKIFKELSMINGQINAMKRKDLVIKLKKYHLNHKGDIMVLRKRLKNHFKITKLTKAKLMEKHNLQPYYVVIDFEATCQENNPVDFNYEIIEFPAILVHTESLKIVDVFHSFVKPVINPKLTAFCQQLTGITQKVVDKAPTFPNVLKKFESWLDSHGLVTERKFIVTDGPWDMGRFFFLQCKLSKLPYPPYAREWTNVRKIFRNFYKYHQGGTLEDMVKFVGLKFEGDPHRGLDDSYNIARMFLHLLKDGALIRVNERITNHCRSHNNMHVVAVPYKSPYNTLDEVQTLRSSLATLNLSLDQSDTEPSDPESVEDDSAVSGTKKSSGGSGKKESRNQDRDRKNHEEKGSSRCSGKRSSVSGNHESKNNETDGKHQDEKRNEKEAKHSEEGIKKKNRSGKKECLKPSFTESSRCGNDMERSKNVKNRAENEVGRENKNTDRSNKHSTNERSRIEDETDVTENEENRNQDDNRENKCSQTKPKTRTGSNENSGSKNRMHNENAQEKKDRTNLSDNFEIDNNRSQNKSSRNTNQTKTSSNEKSGSKSEKTKNVIERSKDSFREQNSQETAKRIEEILNNNGLYPIIRNNKKKNKDQSKRNAEESKDPVENVNEQSS
ncbi:hypothetical protein WDU94_013588 [Cyamophila willieti]